MSKKSHKDNYIQSKIQDNIVKSLNCFKEITKILKESEDYINNTNDLSIADRMAYKGYTYGRILDSFKLYFPMKDGDINDIVSE